MLVGVPPNTSARIQCAYNKPQLMPCQSPTCYIKCCPYSMVMYFYKHPPDVFSLRHKVPEGFGPMIRHGVPSGQTPQDSREVEEFLLLSTMEDGMDKYSRMVLLVPDDYDSWDKIKHCCLQQGISQQTVDEQLELTQKAIQRNPKSYPAWHHRAYFLRHSTRDLSRERRLCSVLLSMDPRNYHCWNHCRAFGIDFPVDFSNFTSILHGRFHSTVENLFTDPSDEAAWRAFHSLLLFPRVSRFADHPSQLYLRVYPSHTDFIFKEPFSGSICIHGQTISLPRPLLFYTLPIASSIYGAHCVCSDEPGSHSSSSSTTSDNTIILAVNECTVAVGRRGIPPEVTRILALDPDCLFALRMKLDFQEADGREETIDRLVRLDPIREDYYRQLVSDAHHIYTQ